MIRIPFKTMRSNKFFLHLTVFAAFFAGSLAHAAQIIGTVTNKTTGKPAAGDVVVLVEPMTGMTEVARTTADGKGHYSLNRPTNAPALVKVTHQGAEFFADAPQTGMVPEISVYDVAPKVDGVFIEADVLELEADNGQLHVIERYFVHNTSMPPRTQWSPTSFEIVLPEEAVVASAEAQRPSAGSLPTSLKLQPDGPKGHYAFNFPIQPDEGDKDTQFQLSYQVPYASGKFTFHPQESLSAQSVGVLLPKSMTFAAGAGSVFQPIQQDPNIQTFVAKNAVPGKALEFTISGTGSMPREEQAAGGGQESSTSTPGTAPGGGIGEPINTPDPLSKYKWWILGGLGIILAAAAAYLLRKPTSAGMAIPVYNPAMPVAAAAAAVHVAPAGKNAALLSALKEELFSLESDKLTGTINGTDYQQQKAALETVLKRALSRK
jgi:hypothetical protein